MFNYATHYPSEPENVSPRLVTLHTSSPEVLPCWSAVVVQPFGLVSYEHEKMREMQGIPQFPVRELPERIKVQA